MKIMLRFLTINLIIGSVKTWDLSTILWNQNYSIEHVSVYYIRAFLCISSNNNNINGDFIPTLIETTWPENLLPVLPKIFPSDLSHSLSDNVCNGIVQAKCTAINEKFGQLWVLDEGSIHCSPKLIAYDILKQNDEVHRYAFYDFPGKSFTSIVIDPGSTNNTRIIATVMDDNFLVVYSMNEQKLWKLRLITNDGMIVVPTEITFRKINKMFVVDRSGFLWITDMHLDDKLTNSTEYYFQLHVKRLANLLGKAEALATDPKGDLYYYIDRDGAIVRWNSHKSLNAENHDVLYFSTVPIIQIIFGAKGSVWVVQKTTENIYDIDHCHRIMYHYSVSSTLAR